MEWSKTNAKAGLGVLNCLTDSSAFVRNYVVSQACYGESVDAHRHRPRLGASGGERDMSIQCPAMHEVEQLQTTPDHELPGKTARLVNGHDPSDVGEVADIVRDWFSDRLLILRNGGEFPFDTVLIGNRFALRVATNACPPTISAVGQEGLAELHADPEMELRPARYAEARR
jgi:hypothetical protein